MNKLQSLQDLTRTRDAAARALKTREQTGTVIAVGMGTCGIAAGARDDDGAQEQLARHHIEAHVTMVGCLGICAREPLVEVRQAEVSRMLYGNITADMVPRLVEEHLVKGKAVKEWVVGRMGGE